VGIMVTCACTYEIIGQIFFRQELQNFAKKYSLSCSLHFKIQKLFRKIHA
jgi:hypothetical protein